MEDCHTHLLSMPGDEEASFFAVFDGHGGVKVAQYAGGHLHTKIVQHPDYVKGNYEQVMKESFISLDDDMMNDEDMKDELAGTTAICVLVKDGKIFCANCGDSRGVMSIRGEAQALSHDHKPSNEAESKRIVAAGGWVEFNRVNGNLALSRALGDFVFKRNDKKTAEEQIVTALPDVTVNDLTEDVEFMVLACDGIWDVLTNQEVIDFIRVRMAMRMEPEYICEELMTRCLAPDCQMGGLGCDNMTVVLICPLHGATYDDAAERCSRPSAAGPHTRFQYNGDADTIDAGDATSRAG